MTCMSTNNKYTNYQYLTKCFINGHCSSYGLESNAWQCYSIWMTRAQKPTLIHVNLYSLMRSLLKSFKFHCKDELRWRPLKRSTMASASMSSSSSSFSYSEWFHTSHTDVPAYSYILRTKLKCHCNRGFTVIGVRFKEDVFTSDLK